MKKILTTLAFVMLSLPVVHAEAQMKNEITDTFTDKIKSIQENENELNVQFIRHAAIYKMPKNNPQFSELKAKLEKLKKEEKKVKIIASLPKMEIKEINE